MPWYAESDPTFDVGGIDSAHKLAILVNLAFGIPVRLDQVHTEGIAGISPVDIEFGPRIWLYIEAACDCEIRVGRGWQRRSRSSCPSHVRAG